MKILQIVLRPDSDIEAELHLLQAMEPNLILVFGGLPFFESPRLANVLQCVVPHAVVAGCSTAGEIAVNRVYDNTCVVTALRFEQTRVAAVSTVINGMDNSFVAGARLAAMLGTDELAAVLLFSTGVAVNGSALVRGLRSALPDHVSISGGLAADAGKFRQTWTLGPQGVADNRIVAIGLYGKHLRVSNGSFAGWQPFGPARKVTRCADNILYELDGKPALEIYKSYLGEYAKDLPSAGLLFPFEMLGPNYKRSGVFRTMLGMNEEDGSLIMAGDIEFEGYLRLMYSTTDDLIDGARIAALGMAGIADDAADSDSLAILVSCVGRKLVMGERIDEEIEAVVDILGNKVTVAGFYSNGEIARSQQHGECRLNNQTMTITWLKEVT